MGLESDARGQSLLRKEEGRGDHRKCRTFRGAAWGVLAPAPSGSREPVTVAGLGLSAQQKPGTLPVRALSSFFKSQLSLNIY